MKAKLSNIEKRTDNNRMMVVTKIDFVKDNGELHHSQEYAHLPEDVDVDYYQRQADVMQNDIDLTKKWAVRDALQAKVEELADAAIGKIKHKLEFGDEIRVKEKLRTK